MNHYATYFDRGFLIQGVALWRSLAAHDRAAVLWVLALDAFTETTLRGLADPRLQVVPLADLEAGDPELAAVQTNRTRVEYTFTLSPCWPRWLLATHPEIERVTYLDADLWFFATPDRVFTAMDQAGASVLITAHRFAPWLSHYEQHGRYNVGILSFRNDPAGGRCLDDWRQRCLEWCHDRVEPGRYADQKYLEAWPDLLGTALLVLEDPGVNLAPWNWHGRRLHRDAEGRPWVDGVPVTLVHFARFRPKGGRWWQSGQLDYGVMPQTWRDALYTPYAKALDAARAELRRVDPGVEYPVQPARSGRAYWRALPWRIVFGGDWLRVGDRFYNLRFGLGRWSGATLAAARKIMRKAEG